MNQYKEYTLASYIGIKDKDFRVVTIDPNPENAENYIIRMRINDKMIKLPEINSNAIWDYWINSNETGWPLYLCYSSTENKRYRGDVNDSRKYNGLMYDSWNEIKTNII